MNNSHISSSSLSSSNQTDEYYYQVMAFFDQEQNLLIRTYANNNQLLAELDGDGDVDEAESSRRGAVPGHITYFRDREQAAYKLYMDYFVEVSVYPEHKFRRRFRMSRNLFIRIADAVKDHDNFFMQQRDGIGKLELSTFQKLTAAFRMLAYGVPADSLDEYIKIGESTAIRCLKRFCRSVIEVFGDRYLRTPNVDDVARLLYIGEERGFPGMLGSLDCMHWRWKNCPTSWAGMYAGRSRSPSIILEVVADYDLWIWHAHFGLPGSNNDINVLEASHLLAMLTSMDSIRDPKGREYLRMKKAEIMERRARHSQQQQQSPTSCGFGNFSNINQFQGGTHETFNSSNFASPYYGASGDHYRGTDGYGGFPHYGASGGSSSSGMQGESQQFDNNGAETRSGYGWMGDHRRNDNNLPKY